VFCFNHHRNPEEVNVLFRPFGNTEVVVEVVQSLAATMIVSSGSIKSDRKTGIATQSGGSSAGLPRKTLRD
jgi:hypothetical protein